MGARGQHSHNETDQRQVGNNASNSFTQLHVLFFFWSVDSAPEKGCNACATDFARSPRTFWPVSVLCSGRVDRTRRQQFLGLSWSLATGGAIVGLAGGLAGCNDDPQVFRCTSSEQCSGGLCQATQYCSFQDPSCEGSGQRYGQYAGDGLANACVSGISPDPTVADADASDGTETASSAGDAASMSMTGNSLSTTGDSTSSDGSSSTAMVTDGSTATSTEVTSATTSGSPTDPASTSTSDDTSSTTSDETTGSSTSGSETEDLPTTLCIPDEFSGTTLRSLWSIGGELPRANASVSDGLLHLTLDPELEGSIVVSTQPTNRYESRAEVELGAIDTSVTTGIQFVFGMGEDDEFIEFQIIGLNLVARYRIGEDYEPVASTYYIADDHRFLGLRVDGDADSASLVWETSEDGERWSTMHTMLRPEDALDMSDALVQILAGTFEVSEVEVEPFTIERYEQCVLVP